MKKIKAILFDSGKVLNKPLYGNWFMPPKFWDHVDKAKYDSIGKRRISDAFNKANDYITKQKFILTKEEEYSHFQKFYLIFSDCLPELDLTSYDIEHIAKDMVYDPDKYVFL